MSDTSSFEDDIPDAEPEDSWDADDDVRDQLANLVRRAILLRRRIAFVALLSALADVVREARLDADLEDRDRLRADDLEADILVVRGRI